MEVSCPSALQTTLGYSFQNPSLLAQALTHPSLVFENKETGPHYQRLEFLGDAILGAILGHMLFMQYKEEREGVLASMRSVLASGNTLSIIAQNIHLNKYIRMSKVEHACSGELRPAVMEDSLEAIIGAIYLDSGSFETTYNIVHHLYLGIENKLQDSIHQHNPKGKLQEWFQEHFSGKGLEYKLIGTQGPAHQKEFFIELWANGKLLASGQGFSKREAEEAAARLALKEIKH